MCAVAPFIVAHHLAAFAEPGAYKTVAMMMVVASMTKRNMTASLDLEATRIKRVCIGIMAPTSGVVGGRG
jgi:hypothetical protein